MLFKGVLKDDQTLEEAKITQGAKVMLMASAAKDIEEVVTAKSMEENNVASKAQTDEPFQLRTEHQKIITKVWLLIS